MYSVIITSMHYCTHYLDFLPLPFSFEVSALDFVVLGLVLPLLLVFFCYNKKCCITTILFCPLGQTNNYV